MVHPTVDTMYIFTHLLPHLIDLSPHVHSPNGDTLATEFTLVVTFLNFSTRIDIAHCCIFIDPQALRDR